MLTKLKLIAIAGIVKLSAYPAAYAQANTTSAPVDHAGWVQIPGELIRPE